METIRVATIAAVLVVAASVLATTAGSAPRAEATHGVFHVPSIGRWQVLSGYNTATHTGDDPYALDIVRLDAPTAGSPVLAPVSGTIRFAGSSSGCIGIEDEHGNTTHICHVFAAAGLDRRDRVEVGQAIGTVAPDGAANNNGIAHIHVAVFGSNGVTIPYTGQYTLDGVAFPATAAYNAYYGTVVTSRNSSSGGTSTGGNAEAFSVDIGEDFVVQPGAAVTLTASADTSEPVLEYEWRQLSGTPVQLSSSGRSISFVAPNEPGASLIFRVIALSTFQNTGSDSIVIQVDPEAAPAASSPPSGGGSGAIVGGDVPASGFGLIVWGGGSSDALLTASGCSTASARFWATSGGAFLTYIPGAQVAAVNAAWETRFGGGIPELTPLLVRCN